MAASVFSQNIKVASHGTRGVPQLDGLEASTQSWKAGSPLIMVSGLLTEATDAADQDPVWGFASDPAAGVVNTITSYIPNVPGILYEAILSNAGNAIALTQAMIGLSYAIAKDSTTKYWYVDQADTTNAEVVVTGYKQPLYAIGSTDAVVFFYYKETESAIAN